LFRFNKTNQAHLAHVVTTRSCGWLVDKILATNTREQTLQLVEENLKMC